MSRRQKRNTKTRLDVGCGFNKQPGFTGMDKRNVKGVDIVHDIENLPWPIKSGECDIVLMSHVMEHIKPWLTIDVMDECWRCLAPGGQLWISMPYGGSFGYYQDPTHCNPWNEATFTYFLPDQPLYQIYKPKPWKSEKITWAIKGNIEAVLLKGVDNGKK